jgi:hypothetical protein
VCLTEKKMNSFPNKSWTAQHDSKYALPYQPKSSSELNSLVMAGMAYPTLVHSTWIPPTWACFIQCVPSRR